MAIVKHIKSKNANYTDAINYLFYQHDEKTKTLLLNEYGQPMLREEFYADGLNCTPETFDLDCSGTNRTFNKNRRPGEIKSHHYIRAEGILYLYGFLRSDKMSRTVYMRSESDAFFGDFSEGSQRKYLKTSAVCQNSPVPIHKFVKASRLFHQFMTGTEI